MANHGPGAKTDRVDGGRRAVLAGVAATMGVGAAATMGLIGAPRAAANVPATTDASAGGSDVENVRSRGAKGDGRHDDTRALQAAIDRAKGHRAVYVPAGTYRVHGPLMLRHDTRIVGAGMWRTTIVLTSGDSLFAVPAGSSARNVDLSALCLDGNGLDSSLVVFRDTVVRELQVHSCRMTNLVHGIADGVTSTAYDHAAFELSGLWSASFDSCLWHNPADLAGLGMAVLVPNGSNIGHVSFTGNNRFLWLNHAMRIHPGDWVDKGLPDAIGSTVLLDGVYADEYWWLLPAKQTGRGGSVSYSGSGLTDSGADFSDVPAGHYPNTIYVRAMPVLRTGTISSADHRRFVEEGQDLAALGPMRGEIVRVPGAFAVIVRPDSGDPGAILVEEWLDEKTLLPTNPPAAGSSYTMYRVLLGQIESTSTSTLQLAAPAAGPGGWFDLKGDYSVVPPDGTGYEIMQSRPGYHVHITRGVESVKVVNSTFKRSHHDQVSGSARNWQIIGNLFMDGQDVATSLSFAGTGRREVMGNAYVHQGAKAAVIAGDDCALIGNRSESAGWRHFGASACHFQFNSSRSCHISENAASQGSESVNSAAGILILGSDADLPASDNLIVHNTCRDLLDADVVFYQKHSTGNQVIGSTSVRYAAQATAQLIDGRGTGSPEGVVTAALGSQYIRLDGGPGETLYIKESGADSTGWVAK